MGTFSVKRILKLSPFIVYLREPGKIIVKLYCIICIHKYTFEQLIGSLNLNVHMYIHNNVYLGRLHSPLKLNWSLCTC